MSLVPILNLAQRYYIDMEGSTLRLGSISYITYSTPPDCPIKHLHGLPAA
jgi:hypothetical protein